MQTFRLSGIKPRCVWCGKLLDDYSLTTDFKEGTKHAQTYKVQVCNESCKKDLIETEMKFEGKAPYFIIALMMFLALSTISLVTFQKHYNMLYLGVLGTLLMGVTTYFLPFVTPQTVKMLGYKKGFRMGRIAGISLIIVGILAGLLVFFTAPGA